MLPTKEEAEQELQIAGEWNPGPWVKHSLNVGIVNIPRHVYEGYKFCMEKGWEEAARICMTHSYVQMQEEFQYRKPYGMFGV